MYIDAEERKKDLIQQNEINGLMFKIHDDPRITKVGNLSAGRALMNFRSL